jgi:hypothetical protein
VKKTAPIKRKATAVKRGSAPNLPRPVEVHAQGGLPRMVGGETVQAVRESWLVEDGWWTECPLRRRYHELVSEGGRNLVVFHDLRAGGWFTQVA